MSKGKRQQLAAPPKALELAVDSTGIASFVAIIERIRLATRDLHHAMVFAR
jgi:hypothetical protein